VFLRIPFRIGASASDAWSSNARRFVWGEGAFSARFGLGVRMLLRACLLKEEKMCALVMLGMRKQVMRLHRVHLTVLRGITTKHSIY
jgi:hypothetical protein